MSGLNNITYINLHDTISSLADEIKYLGDKDNPFKRIGLIEDNGKGNIKDKLEEFLLLYRGNYNAEDIYESYEDIFNSFVENFKDLFPATMDFGNISVNDLGDYDIGFFNKFFLRIDRYKFEISYRTSEGADICIALYTISDEFDDGLSVRYPIDETGHYKLSDRDLTNIATIDIFELFNKFSKVLDIAREDINMALSFIEKSFDINKYEAVTEMTEDISNFFYKC